MLTVGIEQGLEVAGVFEEGGELFYCFIFEGFGGDRFEIAWVLPIDNYLLLCIITKR